MAVWRWTMVVVLLAVTVLPCGARAGATEVRARTIAVAFDERGAMTRLRDLLGQRDLQAAKGVPGVLALRVDIGDESVALAPGDAAHVGIEKQSGGLTLSYTNLGKRGVDATVTVAPAADGLLHWRLSVRLPAGATLAEVRFPILLISAEHDTPDAWVMGSTKGGVYTKPSTWSIGRTVAATQPGSLAAGFACAYDAQGGLYTAAYDKRECPKSVAATRVGEGLYVQWIHPCRAAQRWATVFDIVTGAFRSPTPDRPADWRDAADLYKRWALGQRWCAKTLAQRTDLPAWLRQAPAMVRFYRNWLANPPTIDRWVDAYWRPNFAGVPLIAAYWGWEKVETWVTPDYFPAFPSDRQFIDLAKRLRIRDIHTFLWPSGYHYTLTYDKRPDGSFAWDDRARFDAVARPHAVVAADGRTLIGDRSWLLGGQTATMCGGDAWTRKWFDDIAANCAKRGAEIVQVDQVVGGAFPACYSDQHGHPAGPGPWMTDVFHAQLRSMYGAMRKTQRDAVVCYEEPNEWFTGHAGLQDYRDLEVLGQPGVEPASVFNYLYHEFVPTFQSNPQPGNKLHTAWCLVTGQMPHFVPSMQVGAGPALLGGGFDEWGGDAPAGWDKVGGYQGEVWSGSAARDTTQRHGGRASLRLSNAEPGQTVQVSQNVAIGGGFRVGGRYRLRVWLKSGGVAAGNSIMLGTFADGMRVTWSGGIPIPAAPGDWTRGEATFTVPPDTRLLRIMQHLRGQGTVWLDDMTLEEVRPDGTAREAMRPDKPADHALMRQWVALYHGAGHPYLFLGRTLHPPALEAATQTVDGRTWPAILHQAYQAPDGSRAVVLVNATDAPQTGTLAWAGQKQRLSLKPWEVRMVVDRRGQRATR